MTENLTITHVRANAQNIEMWIATDKLNNISVGHIFLLIEKDNRLKFLDAWVHCDYRRIGIYRNLWDTRWEYVKENYKDYTVYAWCKDTSLPLLIEKEFLIGETVTYVEKKI
jgi:hypothetical protein